MQRLDLNCLKDGFLLSGFGSKLWFTVFDYIGYPFAAMFETMLNETDTTQMGGGLLGDFFATSVNLPVRLYFRKK